MKLEDARGPIGFLDLVRCGAAVVGVLFFATGFDLYGYEAYSTPNPTYVNLALAAVALALVVVDLRHPLTVVRSPLFLWAVAYAAVTTGWAVTLGSRPGSTALMEQYKGLFLLLTMALLFDDARARKASAYALAAAVAIMTAANLLDILGIVKFTPGLLEIYAIQRVEGRASGFIYNSNEAGRAIVFAAATAFWGIRRSWRLPLLLVAAIGVTVTFSRGSMMAFALFTGWVMWRRAIGGWRALAAALVLIIVGAWWAATHAESVLSSVGAWNEDIQGRMRLSQWANDDSGRGALLASAWETFQRAPLAGHPFGEVDLWQPHNQYVAFAIQHGVVGLLLLPVLAVALLLRDPRRMVAFSALLLIAGFFTHVLLLEHTVLVAVAMVGAWQREDAEEEAREGAGGELPVAEPQAVS